MTFVAQLDPEDNSQVLQRKPPIGFSRRALIVSVLSLFVLTAVPYGLSVRNPLWIDEAIFAYMARCPQAPDLGIYQCGEDNKPPGIFLLYRVVRAHDAASIWRVRVVQGAVVLMSSLVLLFWLRREVSVAAGLFAAYGYALLVAVNPGTTALTEPPMALFALMGFYLAYHAWRSKQLSYWLAAGLSLGVASSFKQVAVTDFAGPWWPLYWYSTAARGDGSGQKPGH